MPTNTSCDLIKESHITLSPENLQKLDTNGILVIVSRDENNGSDVAIYSIKERTLSDNIPILSNLGFKIDSEVSLSSEVDGQMIHVRRYFVHCGDCAHVENAQNNVERVIEAVFLGKMRNTPLNALAFHVDLSPLEINLINALAVYESQLLSDYSETLISNTLVKYALTTRHFAQFFHFKFAPEMPNRAAKLRKSEETILSGIREIQNITEDRVLTIFFKIIKALTRTNLYLEKEFSEERALALKVDVTQLYEYLSDVQPRIETFVYHSTLQGTHQRRNNVSRGGLRWSDRYEDFRNEIRLLMRAQRQKNAIITPSGAKGGFVITDPKLTRTNFPDYYKMYINALLDVVDNRIDNKSVHHPDQIIYDDEDSYFVVAADKGTASMSDTANQISHERHFWLCDAFASGGSNGYNHKEMGITAKGAIKSVERFFIESKNNFYETPITVVGIGSPAGDVFGNGILLSQQFKLLAAISSREIFIDPDPDPKTSYKERRRLFDRGLGWRDYNPKKISTGGGIFRKQDKEIAITPEMKKVFGIKKELMNGEELSRVILSAKVDLLFNGGVGTYVKGSEESNTEIGDKPNESVRINAKDVKAYAVCEGGNLGFTSKARIEFAKRGGKITTDSIDNSAGVQTSDYEVNLKIILNNLVSKGIIQEDSRTEMLFSVISEIEKTVLLTNYFQALSLSLDEIRSCEELHRFKDSVVVLEDHVENFRRSQFQIPSRDEFHSILTKDNCIIRPILATMLSYSKIFVKSFLMKEKEFIQSDFAIQYLYRYFPKTIVALYKKEVESHPLQAQIITTYIANKIINFAGTTFIHDFNTMDRSQFLLKIRAYLAINQLISADDVRHEIFRLDYQLPAKKQYELLLSLSESISFLVDWVLEHGEHSVALFDHLPEYKKAFREFIDSVDPKYVKAIVPDSDHLNRFFSMIDYVRMSLTILNVKESTHQDFLDVANLFFTVTQDLEILILTNSIKQIDPDSYWEDRLKTELEKEIFETIYQIIEKIMRFKRSNESIQDAYQSFVEIHRKLYDGYFKEYNHFKASTAVTMVSLSVVINTLKKIAHAN